MSIIAECSVNLPEYQAVTDALLGRRLVLEREVAYNPKTGALTFWTSSVDPETFESDMQRLNLITDIQQWNNQVSG